MHKVVDRGIYCIYIQSMLIAFDTAKDAINMERHGLSLAFGSRIFADAAHIVFSTARAQDGEDRSKVVGMVDGKLYTGVHVVREEVIRFISVRRSNDGERRIYDRA